MQASHSDYMRKNRHELWPFDCAAPDRRRGVGVGAPGGQAPAPERAEPRRVARGLGLGEATRFAKCCQAVVWFGAVRKCVLAKLVEVDKYVLTRSTFQVTFGCKSANRSDLSKSHYQILRPKTAFQCSNFNFNFCEKREDIFCLNNLLKHKA